MARKKQTESEHKAEAAKAGTPARDAIEAKKTDEAMVPPPEGFADEPEELQEPPKLEPLAAPKPEKKPEPPEDTYRMTARQYIRTRGIKYHRGAGFLYEMTQFHGPRATRTRSQWGVDWEKFFKRPVKGPR